MRAAHDLDPPRLRNRQHVDHELRGRARIGAHDAQQTVAVDFVFEPANKSLRCLHQHVRLLRAHLSQIEDRGDALDERSDVGRDDLVASAESTPASRQR